MGRRISNHSPEQIVFIRFRFSPKIFDIDISFWIGSRYDNLQTGHSTGSRIRTMSGGGDQHHLPVTFSTGNMILT